MIQVHNHSRITVSMAPFLSDAQDRVARLEMELREKLYGTFRFRVTPLRPPISDDLE